MKTKLVVLLVLGCGALSMALYVYHKKVGLKLRELDTATVANANTIHSLERKLNGLESRFNEKKLSEKQSA
jgi:hypothetical protein